MMSIPQWLTDPVIVSQFTCLAAVHYCSTRSVAERTANLLITPPVLTEEDKSKVDADKKAAEAAKAAAGPPKPWYKRIWSRKTLEAMIPLLCFAVVEFGIIWVLPRISSEIFMQVFWLVICSYMIIIPLAGAMFAVLAGPMTMAFVRGGTNKKSVSVKIESATPYAKPFFYRQRNRRILAGIITAALYLYTYHDANNLILRAFGGIVIVSTATSISYRVISVRVMTMICVGFISLGALIVPIVMGLIRVFGSDTPKAEPSKMPVMPDWILSLMMIYNDALLASPVLFLAMLALRYDHFRPTSPIALGPAKAAPGEPVPIPPRVAYRTGPMYRTTMALMMASYLGSSALVYHLFATGTLTTKATNFARERSDCIKLLSFGLVNVLVPLGVAFMAWTKGELRTWWTYYEEWVSKNADEPNEQADIDDAEKALLEPEREVQDVPSVDEKAALAI